MTIMTKKTKETLRIELAYRMIHFLYPKQLELCKKDADK